MEDKSIVSVIFGASGDLTWRKLVPALYDMYYRGLLPGGFKVLGVGRAQLTDESFREKMKEGLDRFVPASFVDQQRMAHFLQQLHYHAMDTNAAKDYEGLRRRLGELSQTADRDDYLYYFAMPPFMYAPVASYLHTVGLTRRTSAQSGFRRVIIEKPFGHDAPSAANLNRELLRYFSEDQIYRIDHYLGKEAVQNMLVMRFSNGIFEPLWNRNYVEYVEITSSEALGVGSRAGYYESAGALRDMVQNHLLQLMAFGAMDPPVSSDEIAIRKDLFYFFL